MAEDEVNITGMSSFTAESDSPDQSCFRFVYDRDSGTFFTRTPRSWAKIGFFYLIYYSCLAGFFAGMLSIFLYGFTDDMAPKLTGNYSVLPQNPCMGFRPQPKEDTSLIKFHEDEPDTYKDYVEAMDAFLVNPRDKPKGEKVDVNYFVGQDEKRFNACSENTTDPSVSFESKPCAFNVSAMDKVVNECFPRKYGFASGQPCVIVKLNRIYEFIPILTNASQTPHLEIRCEGLSFADEDNIGHVDYYPKAGVDMWYFPFVGQKDYLSPLVFVKFRNVTRNVLVQVVCRPANAANIVQHSQSRASGRVQFEVLVEAWDPAGVPPVEARENATDTSGVGVSDGIREFVHIG